MPDFAELLRDAAAGDGKAQCAMACEALRIVAADEADPLITGLEGVTYARMAVAQGHSAAVGVLVEHLCRLAAHFDKIGDDDASDDYAGQAIAVCDIAADHMPDVGADKVRASVDEMIGEAGPRVAQYATTYRNIIEPMFGPLVSQEG